MRTWFTAKAAANNAAEVAIYSDIGAFGVTSGDFRDALASLGEVGTINVRLNSPGGAVFDGLAIHNMLARHPAKVVVTVDGLAASIASLVAMAGDEVIMPENAMMMIHNPAGLVMGNANDMQDMADALNKIREGMVSSYAAKSKLEPDAIVAMMDAETWLTAQEAVAHGFADRVAERAKITAKFDISKYKNAPPTPAPTAAYDPDGDGDDDILECLGYLGNAVDAIADAVGCLTGTGDPDAATTPAVAALRASVQAVSAAKRIENPTAAAQSGNATVGGAPGKDADKPAGEPAPTGVAAAADASNTGRADEMIQIAAACEIAGFAAKASEFLRSGKSLSAVMSELRAMRADVGRGDGDQQVSARHAVQTNAPGATWGKTLDKINSRIPDGV